MTGDKIISSGSDDELWESRGITYCEKIRRIKLTKLINFIYFKIPERKRGVKRKMTKYKK